MLKKVVQLIFESKCIWYKSSNVCSFRKNTSYEVNANIFEEDKLNSLYCQK